MIAMSGAIGGTLLRKQAGKPGQSGGEIFAVAIAFVGLRFQTVELRVKHGTLKFSQPIVARDDVMFIPDATRHPTAVLNGATGLRQRIVVGGDDAAFS